MALGRQVVEEVDEQGRVTRYRPREVPPEQATSPGDMRAHATLSAAFGGTHVYKIEIGKPIEVKGHVPFVKYAITIPTIDVCYIGLDRQPSVEGYDAKHHGGANMADRCEPTSSLWLLFESLPADEVEVYLYAGAPALPL